MKTKFTFFFLLMVGSVIGYSQLTITEISYNPPESGTDSLEYIEVYNKSNAAVNVKDWKFSKGITYTFPDVSIAAGQYFLIVKNARAFKTVYNITAPDWSPTDPVATTNTLTNGGEILEIVDKADNVIVSFKYAAVAPWPGKPEGTDGNGKSIELCKVDLDPTLGTSWKASSSDLGFMHNAKAVFGTPGRANVQSDCAVVPDAIVEVSSFKFSPADLTIDVGKTVRWVNLGGGHNVNGKVSSFPNNPESFSNGPASSESWTYDFTFTKPGVYDYQCDPHANSMKGKVTVLDPTPQVSYPDRSIALVTTVNANGVADSLGKNCALTGIVYGVNLRPAGLQFTIIDAENNGIGIFNANNNLGYTVKQGDKVKVEGVVGQFNGFTQMTAATVSKVSEGNNLIDADPSDTPLIESQESSLVSIFGSPDFSTWTTGTGSGFNISVAGPGGITYAVRIDNDVDAFLLPAPATNIYNITGLVGQFDASEPYTEGYQLLPRYILDFDPFGAVSDSPVNISLSPNPTSNLLEIVTDEQVGSVVILDQQGRLIVSGDKQKTFDVTNLAPGVYVVQISINDKQISRRFWKF
jgi:plastocyanin